MQTTEIGFLHALREANSLHLTTKLCNQHRNHIKGWGGCCEFMHEWCWKRWRIPLQWSRRFTVIFWDMVNDVLVHHVELSSVVVIKIFIKGIHRQCFKVFNLSDYSTFFSQVEVLTDRLWSSDTTTFFIIAPLQCKRIVCERDEAPNYIYKQGETLHLPSTGKKRNSSAMQSPLPWRPFHRMLIFKTSN